MASISIEIKGLREAQRRAERILRDMSGPPLVEAVRRGLLMVTRDAKINAPWATGRLKSSITPEIVSSGGARVEGIVGTNVSYAPYQEFGTWLQGPKARGPNMGIAPKRYLRGALEKNATQIAAAIARAFQDMLRG